MLNKAQRLLSQSLLLYQVIDKSRVNYKMWDKFVCIVSFKFVWLQLN